jgi:uncharacterized membrane protein YphA (DoxX/SURF4 family)
MRSFGFSPDKATADDENMINFYKNLSIIGGLLLLCVTGAGKFSADVQRERRQRTNQSL